MKKKSGPPTILTEAEENVIAKWAVDIGKLGFPVTKDQLGTKIKQTK